MVTKKKTCDLYWVDGGDTGISKGVTPCTVPGESLNLENPAFEATQLTFQLKSTGLDSSRLLNLHTEVIHELCRSHTQNFKTFIS